MCGVSEWQELGQSLVPGDGRLSHVGAGWRQPQCSHLLCLRRFAVVLENHVVADDDEPALKRQRLEINCQDPSIKVRAARAARTLVPGAPQRVVPRPGGVSHMALSELVKTGLPCAFAALW